MNATMHKRGFTRIVLAAGVLAAMTAMTALPGCRMPRSESARMGADSVSRIDFFVEPSMREVLVGETVTLTARDRNTAGREPQIEWTTTGGELTTERNNRVARITFDTPGTFTITGRLNADDVVITDSVDIVVRPLR